MRRAEVAGKPSAPGLRVRRWEAGSWSESPDSVVMEEPLQLMLDGEPLSLVMRTPGADIELALGLLFAEGVLRSASDVKLVRISAEAGEKEPAVDVDASLMESNQVDVQLAVNQALGIATWTCVVAETVPAVQVAVAVTLKICRSE